MNKRWIAACIGLALLILYLTGAALASIQSFNLSKWAVANGGGSAAGGNYALEGTIGQSATTAMAGGSYHLGGGFWHNEDTPAGERRIFLPMIVGSSAQSNNRQMDGPTEEGFLGKRGPGIIIGEDVAGVIKPGD